MQGDAKKKRVFVSGPDGKPYSVTIAIPNAGDAYEAEAAKKRGCAGAARAVGTYTARVLQAAVGPPVHALVLLLLWPLALLNAIFCPKVARALPVELSDRWWWGARGGGCDATGLKQSRGLKLLSFVLVRCLPRWALERLDKRMMARSNADAQGSMLAMVDEYNALKAAPTIAKGMKELGMSRLDEWFWRPCEISQTPSPYTHPLLRPVQYVPIPTVPFPDVREFEWIARIESQYLVVKEELHAVLRSNRGWAEPLLPDFMGNAFRSAHKGKLVDDGDGIAPAGQQAQEDNGAEGADDAEGAAPVGDWQQLMFNTPLGTSIEENKEAMPKTWELLKSIPGFVDNNFAMISSLRPGGRIAPHVGHTNLVMRLHLAIDVPEPNKAAIRVGNDIRTWQEGKVLLLNDAYDHEVWTFGTKNRTVLFADIWNPSLTEEDIAALKPHWDAQKNTLGVMAHTYEAHAKKQGESAGSGSGWYES